MSNPIKDNAYLIVEKLIELEVQRQDDVYADGELIKSLTNLTSRQINDAVEIMYNSQWVERTNFLGSDPYSFGMIRISSVGKNAYYEQNNDQTPNKTNTMSSTSSIEIFISHSNQDATIAKALIELIRSSLNTNPELIRCTSVSGFKLPTGVDTNAQLQEEIYSSKAFIGLISNHSINSTYVLFELGARWGAKLPLFPLLTNPAGPELLKGPLRSINALSACVENDLFQFIGDLAKLLQVTLPNASVYKDKIDGMVKLCLESTIPGGIVEKAASKLRVNENASDNNQNFEIIIKEEAKREWPDDFSMQVHFIEQQQKAVLELRQPPPTDIDSKLFADIREKAKQEWPVDFSMQVHSIKQQVEAIRKLKTM